MEDSLMTLNITETGKGVRMQLIDPKPSETIYYSGIPYTQPHLFAALQKWGYTQEEALDIMHTKVVHLGGGK
jgi:hypothetical protein